MPTLQRREFLLGSAAALTLSSPLVAAANKANNKVVLALMGAHNRGSQLATLFGGVQGVEIAYVCDVDSSQLEKGAAAVARGGQQAPVKSVTDFRHALDDPNVDGLICAVPNHWHAAATIAACQAGKHVYVEKPCSHTAEEGKLMIAAAESEKRIVQVGMQRRSGALYQKMVEKVRGGAIGEVLLGKSYFNRNRPSIGHAEPSDPPDSLDYDMWQGPATEQPYRSNILHYTWHNFWHWGNAEIGNNGVHTIDICRWAMGIDLPTRVHVQGSNLRYDDDQETPDTTTAQFECGNKLITWEGISWSDPYEIGKIVGMEFRGTEGTLLINDLGYTIYDLDRKPIETEKGSRGDTEHLNNFVNCIRGNGQLNADLIEGHRSAMFCHLANIAYRTGQSLDLDYITGELLTQGRARDLLRKEYRDKWMPKV